MMDAQAQINAILGSANLSQDDATQAARTVDQLGNVTASGNLMASEMIAALSASSSATLESIEKEFKDTQARVKSNLELLPKNGGTKAVNDAAEVLEHLVALLDFTGDLYGRRVIVELWDRLRDEASFASEAELIAQIVVDVEATRATTRP